MKPARQIDAKTVVIDGQECTIRVFEAALPKSKKTKAAKPSQKVRPRNEDDWSIPERTSSRSNDLPSKAFGRRSRHEERHREEDER